jgi:hypothetical protein
MEDFRTELAEAADALVEAAERFERSAGSRDCVPFVATSLASLAAALDALSRAVDATGHAIVPPAGAHETIAARYARAAMDWPAAPDGGALSHEQQAHLLSTLHEARTALGAASKSASRARDVAASTLGPVTPPRVAGPGLAAASR